MSTSAAVLVTTSVVSSAIVRLAWTGSSGALFTSLTVTVKLLVALRLGTPLSKTRTVTVLVLGPWASVGVQLIRPLEPTVSPAGPDTSAKVSVLGGESVSVAVALALRGTSSLIVWFPGTLNTGAVFTSLTVRVKLLVTLRLGTP